MRADPIGPKPAKPRPARNASACGQGSDRLSPSRENFGMTPSAFHPPSDRGGASSGHPEFGHPDPGYPARPASARPTTVTYAFAALVINIALGLLAAILVFANHDAYIEQALRDTGREPGLASEVDVTSLASNVAVIGLLFVALWVMVLGFAWNGRNWARIVIWILGGLDLIDVFGAFDSPIVLVVVLDVVNAVLVLAAVILLALTPSNDWYRHIGHVRRTTR